MLRNAQRASRCMQWALSYPAGIRQQPGSGADYRQLVH